MSNLRLGGAEPTAIRVTHIGRGLDPDRPDFEVWYVSAVYGTAVTAETILATCDYPNHARAVASALGIAYAVPVEGDEPPRPVRAAPRPPAALPIRRPGRALDR